MSEPLPPDVRQLAENLAERLATYLQTPFALFGHSMGALVCYEFARVLRNRSLPTPAHLFASGWRAPQIPDLDPPTHRLPDHAFLDKVRRLNGTSEGVLEEPELLELVLPLLRGDFALVENYTYQPGMPLDCPISVFGGAHDPKVTREKLEPWRTQTSASFKLRIFPGDHFFLNTSRLELLKAISDELSVHF